MLVNISCCLWTVYIIQLSGKEVNSYSGSFFLSCWLFEKLRKGPERASTRIFGVNIIAPEVGCLYFLRLMADYGQTYSGSSSSITSIQSSNDVWLFSEVGNLKNPPSNFCLVLRWCTKSILIFCKSSNQ